MIKDLSLLTFLIVFQGLVLFGQVTNDDCSNAENLGTLPTPVACPSGIGSSVSRNGTNVGAVAETPYQYVLNCQGGAQTSPASDVWYSFVATGTILDLTISGAISNPNVALYNGSCGNLNAVGCAVGSGGSWSTTIGGLVPGSVHYLQISGSSLTDQGAFSLTVQNNFDCNACLITSTLSANPAPINGTYLPGTVVDFCFNVTDWEWGSTQNWFHGIVPIMGNGWSSTITNMVPALTCGTGGSWSWYNSVILPNGLGTQSGFFFERAAPNLFADGNPANNYGDNCNGTAGASDWVFCWRATALNCPPGSQGMDLSVQVETYADGESGGWASPSCQNDPVYNFSATLACCTTPTMSGNGESCAGDSDGDATAVGQGTGPWDYVWRDASGSIMLNDLNNAGQSTVSNLAPGQYTVNVTDNSGCTETGVYNVTAGPSCSPCSISYFSYTLGLCDASTTTYRLFGELDYTSGPTSGTLIIRVDNGTSTYDTIINSPFPPTNGTGPNADDVTWSISGIPSDGSNSIVTVWFSNSPGCTQTLNFVAPSIPNANSGLDDDVCVLNYNLNAIPSFGTGTWSGAGGVVFGNINSPTSSIAVPSGGSYTLTWTEDNTNGCFNSDDVIIEFSDVQYSETPTDPSCGNNDGQIVLVASGGIAPYTYSIDNGITIQSSGSFSSLSSGSYNIVVSDDNGCTASSIIMLSNQIGTTISSVVTNDITCNGACNGSITINATGATQFSIDNGVNFQSSNVFSMLCVGTYDIVVQDAGGCTDNNQVTLVGPPPVSISTSGSISICEEDTATLIANGSGGVGNFTYAWDNGEGTQSINASPVSTQTYCVVATDGNGCPTAQSCETVTVNSIPVISFSGDSLTGCVPLTVEFEDINVPSGSTCSWTFGDGFTNSNCGVISHTYSSIGCWDVGLSITTSQGCQASISTTNYICVGEYPNSDFEFTHQPVTTLDPTVNFTNLTTGASDHTWIFDIGNGGLNVISTAINPSFTFLPSAGMYEVCLTSVNQDGCVADTCKMVEVVDEFIVYVPDAFTPNGDPINNTFRPIISGAQPETYRLLVFNRWGELLFQTSDLEKDWDGTYLGKSVPEGVYVWRIKIKDQLGKERKYTGNVSVIR